MTKGSNEGVAPDGNEADDRTKICLENIKNGVSKKSAEQLLEENPPSKKLEKEIAKAENKVKPKSKSKFPRDDTKDLESFVDHCVKRLDMQLVMVAVDNKQIPEEWTLEHKGKRVAWICPRASMRFGVYLFLKGSREIIKVYSKEDMDDVFSKIRTRCAEIDQEPVDKQKPKKSKNGKGGQSVIAKLELAEAKARRYKDSNGFSLGNIKVTQDVMDWCEKKGYKLQSRSVKW